MTAVAATPAVRERGILFTGPNVRAILDGRKSQTRRPVKQQPLPHNYFQLMDEGCWREVGPDYPDTRDDDRWCPYGSDGDRLYVRESWAARGAHTDRYSPKEIAVNRSHFEIWYAADCFHPDGRERFNLDFLGRWRPSIHMPRSVARLWLEITRVRVERIQAISTFDIEAEGVSITNNHYGARNEFRDRWNALNAKRGAGWDANPWVWVIDFRRVA